MTAVGVEGMLAKLRERADWLRYEYLHGGSYEHLKPREDECRYIADKIVAPAVEAVNLPALLACVAALKELNRCCHPENFRFWGDMDEAQTKALTQARSALSALSPEDSQ